jgi:hypothetical protein
LVWYLPFSEENFMVGHDRGCNTGDASITAGPFTLPAARGIFLKKCGPADTGAQAYSPAGNFRPLPRFFLSAFCLTDPGPYRAPIFPITPKIFALTTSLIT